MEKGHAVSVGDMLNFALKEKIDKAKVIEKTKKELYREARGNFSGFLEQKKDDQPFVYWFGPTNVHRKWTKWEGGRQTVFLDFLNENQLQTDFRL